MIKKINKNAVRQKRHWRMRKHLSGSAVRPRLNVYRSSGNIYAQIIDDVAGHTLVSASTLDAEVKGQIGGKTPKECAKTVGLAVAKRAKDKGIDTVVFDRGGYLYTGRVAELAAGAREGGLEF